MDKTIETERAKRSNTIYEAKCLVCGYDVVFTEDDCYDKCNDDGTYQTCVDCPNCKNEIEL